MPIDLVCPACRTRTAERIELRTLTRAGDLLVCACGRRCPVIDGVPLIVPDPADYLRTEVTAVVERELAPELSAALVEAGPDDAAYPRLLEHLSIYLDAHWGDRAEPALASTATDASAVIAQLARLPRVPLAVELGCSVGRIVGELATTADHVVGVDLSFGALRRARRLLDGEPVAYGRRITGRHYATAIATAGDRAVPAARRTLVCGDALDPPLVPGTFDRVVALNLLDAVRSPRQLLSVCDGLCAPGGELILASPFAWQSGIVEDHERIGGADPAAGLAAILETGDGLGRRYRIEDTAELGWTLRRDARSTLTYRIHYVRARAIEDAGRGT